MNSIFGNLAASQTVVAAGCNDGADCQYDGYPKMKDQT
jgi:hypothetical protein